MTNFMFFPSAVPIGSPRIITAVAMSPTEICVMWQEVPLAEQNGEIIVYEVQYRALETCDRTAMSVNLTNTTITFIILTGLEEYVEYNISVRAYTSVGPGPYSYTVMERTNESCKIYSFMYMYLPPPIFFQLSA